MSISERLRDIGMHHPKVCEAVRPEGADEIDRLTTELATVKDAYDKLDDDKLDDDADPITEFWLLSIGFLRVPSEMGSNYSDHLQRNDVNLWEFNGSGEWLWREHDSVSMRTRKKVRDLLRWLGDDGRLTETQTAKETK